MLRWPPLSKQASFDLGSGSRARGELKKRGETFQIKGGYFCSQVCTTIYLDSILYTKMRPRIES